VENKDKSRFGIDSLLVGPAGALIIGAKLSEFISPELFPFLAICGLVFPAALMVFSLGVVLRLFRRDWKGMIWPVLLIFWIQNSVILTIGGWGTSSELMPDSKQISIGTYNVRRMDEYEWLEGDKTRDEIVSWLSENKFDIMCFQEFPSNMKGRVSEALGGKEFLVNKTGSGPAIATSLHIAHYEPWFAPGEDVPRGIFADVIQGGDTIRIFNVHLQSVGLKGDDYDAVREGPDAEQRKRLFSRLSSAYVSRAAQARAVREAVESSPYPIILLGDFNDTPVSFTLSTLKGPNSNLLLDAFAKGGEGLGATYVGEISGLRIDYILYADIFKLQSFNTYPVELSDHRPISAVFSY
jgi:endonuclease/exonuclease/phosphatase family metal-dependent hydrolase